jgi:hypothetical protein
MKLYTVLPYTKNYSSPRTNKLQSFTDYTEAIQYASEFKCVEIVTQTLPIQRAVTPNFF